MTVKALVAEVEQCGIQIEPRGNRIWMDTTKGLSDDLSSRLWESKPAVLKFLNKRLLDHAKEKADAFQASQQRHQRRVPASEVRVERGAEGPPDRLAEPMGGHCRACRDGA